VGILKQIRKIGQQVVHAPGHLVHSVTHPVQAIKNLPKHVLHGAEDVFHNLSHGSMKILKALPNAAVGMYTAGPVGAAAGAFGTLTKGKKGGKKGGSKATAASAQSEIDERVKPKSRQEANLAAFKAGPRPAPSAPRAATRLPDRNTPGRLRGPR